MRGAFIVLEGCDRVGKTTQAALLCDALRARGSRVLPLKFPKRDGPTGVLLASYLKGLEMHPRTAQLLFSANRWEEKNNIEELLDSGAHVVCDRYVHSGVVYAAASGAPPSTADVGLPAPDMVLHLDMPVATLLERDGFGEERYEERDVQRKARVGFLQFRKHTANWLTFDAESPVAELSYSILTEVTRRLPHLGPRRTLCFSDLVQ